MGITIALNEGVATLTMKLPGRANVIGEPLIRALAGAVEELESAEGLRGVLLTSGHRDFCAGADLEWLYGERDAAVVYQGSVALNQTFRRLERLGVPVVACIEGAALGGGYEIALACSHRIALDSPKIQVGLPEVSLGLIPGAGGTQRLPYLVGIQRALEHIGAGQPLRAPQAARKGFVDALAPDHDSLMAAALAFIEAHPKHAQPWDQKRWSFPGGVRPGTPMARNVFIGAAGFLQKKTAGAFPAAETALQVIHEGLGLSFDRGLEVEARAFAHLATSDQAKDMIRTFFFHRTAVLKHAGLPGVLPHGIEKVAILGAGMMGAGLAFICAKAGFSVVLKDVSGSQLERAQAHIHEQAGELGRLDEAARTALLQRVALTLEDEPIRGSDLIIEAVPEVLSIKHAELRRLQGLLAEDGIWASNTSAIPIGMLNEHSADRSAFIGLHFFSPVEKMPLLEIITTEHTSERTLARCLAFGDALKKVSVVVNDGYGFFTSRFFASYLIEGAQLVAEGHDPVLVEYAARAAGMVMPPLKVFDEVTLSLGAKAFTSRELVTGEALDLPGIDLVLRLVELGRNGKIVGQGFYDWQTRTIWSGLSELTAARPSETGLVLIQERLMLAQLAELGRAFDEGILNSARDADIAAIFGLGFAPNTGGPCAYADRYGLPELVARLSELAARHGERFKPAAKFRDMASAGERFYD